MTADTQHVSQRTNANVLLIDDDIVDREKINDLLSIESFDVQECYRLEDVVKIVRSTRVDLVLLDIKLDESDEYNRSFKLILKYLQTEVPEAIIVILSGFIDELEKDIVNDYCVIDKDIVLADPALLIHQIKEAIGLNQAEIWGSGLRDKALIQFDKVIENLRTDATSEGEITLLQFRGIIDEVSFPYIHVRVESYEAIHDADVAARFEDLPKNVALYYLLFRNMDVVAEDVRIRYSVIGDGDDIRVSVTYVEE